MEQAPPSSQKGEIADPANHVLTSKLTSTFPQDDDANPVPGGPVDPFRRRVLQRNDPEISRVKLKASLKVLPDQHCTAAREPKLIRGSVTVPIAFNDNGTLDIRIAVLRESGIQERVPLRGQLLAIQAVLEQLRSR